MLEESLAPLARQMDSLRETYLTEEEREEIQRDIEEAREDIRQEQKELREEMQKNVEIRVRKTNQDGEKPDYKAEVDRLVDEIVSTIETYGSTLTTLNDDEMLMISIDWNGWGEMNSRTEVRIRKSDLLEGKKPEIVKHRR